MSLLILLKCATKQQTCDAGFDICNYSGTIKNGFPHYERPTKKDYSEYRVHGTQSNRHEPSVSTQKSVLKNIHGVLRYWQKCIWVVQRFLPQVTKSNHKK